MSNKEYRLDSEEDLGTASQVATTLETDTSAGGEVRVVARPIGGQSGPTRVDTSHVDCVMAKLGDNLSEQQKAVVDGFVRRNADVFSASEFDLGRTNLLQHSIELSSTKPVRQALRRHPVAYLPLIDQNLHATSVLHPHLCYTNRLPELASPTALSDALLLPSGTL